MYFLSYFFFQTLPFVVCVPLCTISRVEKVGSSTSNQSRSAADGRNPFGLEIFCKDMRILRFVMRQESRQRKTVYEKLEELCFPVTNKNVGSVYFEKNDFYISYMKPTCAKYICLCVGVVTISGLL